MNARAEAVKKLLDQHVLFGLLPAEDKRELLPLFEVRSYKPQQEIVVQGSAMDGMYIIHQGRIRLKQATAEKRYSLGELSREASFGEISLIHDIDWPFTAVAVDHVTVLYLSTDLVKPVLARHPNILQMFKKHIGMVETSHRIRGMLGDGDYTPEELAAILQKVGVKRIKAGATVFEQGDEDPRLYFLEHGEVVLERTPLQGDPVVLDKLRFGDLFGESGALDGLTGTGIQATTARALTDITVLVIPQEQVRAIFAINPGLREQLRMRVHALQSNEEREIASRQRAEGVDQRIRLADAVTEDEFRELEKRKEIRRFPYVQQISEADAAAACLTMICQFYGKEFTLGQIRELTNLERDKVTPASLITGAETLGYNAKAYALRFEDLREVKLPAIVGWEGYHYVVLFRVTRKDVHICDPQQGIRKIRADEFTRSWTEAQVVGVDPDPGRGVLIALEPTQRFEQRQPPKKPIYHFINYMLPFKKYYAEAMLAALAINLLGLASPLFVQTIVDTVVVHQDISLLNMMLVGMVLVTILSTATTAVQSLLLAHTTARIDLRMMSEFYRHVLSLPMGFFLSRNKGDILNRFGQNARIREFLASSTITVILNSLMIVVYLAMMFAYSSALTLLVLVFIPAYVILVMYYTPRIKAVSQDIFLTNTQSQSHLIEALNGIETLKATDNEYMARSKWESAFVDNVKNVYRSAKLNLASTSWHKLIGLGSTVAILWMGANQVIQGSMTIGELMGFNMLVGLVISPIQQLVGLFNKITELKVSVDRVGEILAVEPEQEMASTPERLRAVMRDCQGQIVFEKVNFSYVANDKENFVMKDFDLEIPAGTRVAFVGPSGCGKSTIAKMILGFNIPKSGSCFIDGKELRSIDLGSLRRNIGVVLQDSFLFSGTVAENIALGDPAPDMKAVEEAAKLAGAHEFVINYPLGYQTLVGERGIGISGGQRQRLCIARALYRNPKILIFDEATSALDNESERQIQRNMDSILKGRTSITIAHRLSTVVGSDMICYIFDGKVAEKGRHEELTDVDYLRDKGYRGLYYRLAQSQFDLPPLPETL